MSAMLQKLSSISGAEYGLLEALASAGFVDRTELIACMQRIVDDRLTLADDYLDHARACDLTKSGECRQAISRAYYAAHHAGRAVAYEVRRRDVATHDGVIAEVKQILGEQSAGIVRELHRLRNQVEYELYLPWLDLPREAEAARIQADEFVSTCRTVVIDRR